MHYNLKTTFNLKLAPGILQIKSHYIKSGGGHMFPGEQLDGWVGKPY